MSEHANGSPDRVAALASRLRLVQVDFAEQAEDVRRGYLSDEIGRALAPLVPAERAAFLRELQARFPTWDGADVEPRPVATAGRGTLDEKELRDPGFLVTRLIEACRELPEQQRRAVTDQLQAAGLVGVGATDWHPPAAAEARQKLAMASNERIDALRALELVSSLSEFVCSVDQVVWSAWRAIAPQTNVKRPGGLQKVLARFLTGDPQVPRGQVAQDIAKLRQLVASLVAAIPQAGRFAMQHFKRVSPDEIKVLVGTGGFGVEGKCWRKYVELAGTIDGAAMEDEIRNAIAEYAETLMKAR